jgi:large subunit ribosomal protein L25
VVLRVSDLPHSDKLRFITSEDKPVAHVISIKEEVVAAPEVAATEVAAVPAEPEVLKKGKQETAEGAPAAAAAPVAEKSEKGGKK